MTVESRGIRCVSHLSSLPLFVEVLFKSSEVGFEERNAFDDARPEVRVESRFVISCGKRPSGEYP